MILFTGDVSWDGSKVELLCTICRKSCGYITWDEVGGLLKQKEEIYCFDCEGTHLDYVPNMLMPTEKESVIIVYPPKGAIVLSLEGEPYRFRVSAMTKE